MPEPAANYYEMFPEISPEMRAEDIRRALEKKAAVLANRLDDKSLKLQDQIEAALGVFGDEAGKRAYDRALAECRRMQPAEDPLQKQQEELENLKQRAESYLSDGEYDLAGMAIEKVLQLDAARTDSGAHRLAARVFRASKAYDSALEHINRVIFEEPENADPLLFKAALYAEKAGQLKESPHFSASPQLRQEAAKCRAERRRQLKKAAELAKKSGGETEARARGLLAHALYFDPDPDARANDRAAGVAEAQAAQRCGTSGEARAVLEDHAEMQQASEWFDLAKEHYDKREYNPAKTLIDKALAAAETPAAIEAGRTPSAEAYRLASNIYYSLGEHDPALQLIESAIRLEPQHCGLIIDKGLILAEKVEKLQRSSGFRSSAQQQGTYRKIRAMELETLREAYRKAAGADNLQRREITAQMLAHELYFGCDALDKNKARQERGEGVKFAREALSYENSSCAFAQEVLDDYTAKQKAQREKQLAQQKAQQEKQKAEWEAQLKRIQGFCDDGQFDVAKTAIEKVLREDANRCDSKVYALAAGIYHKNGEYDTALQFINEALAREPGEIAYRMRKADICFGKAEALAERPGFQNDPPLQEEYRSVRTKGFELLDAACDEAEQTEDHPLLADLMGTRAYELYFRPNKTDAKEAAKEKLGGWYQAQDASRIFFSSGAQAVLDEENPKKAGRDRWIKCAREHRNKREWAQARNAVSQALDIDVAEHSDKDDADLYWLAADIYYNDSVSNDDAALQYINKALALSPDNVEYNVLKGCICCTKADWVTQYAGFRSSSARQKEYAKLRALGLEALRKAVRRGEENDKNAPGSKQDKRQYAEALGELACALYDFSDALNASKARAEKKDALAYARRAQELAPGRSREAREVLDKENGKKSERSTCTKRAREYRDKKEWKQAQSAISRALNIELVESSGADDAYLYWLAASIYHEGNIDCDIALQYINKALALKPDDVYHNVLKGLILGKKALQLANSSNFQSSAGLRQQYRTLRGQELAAFDTAGRRATDLYNQDPNNSDRKSAFAYVLGEFSYALYFGADRLDGQKAEEEHYRGADLAQIAQTCSDQSVWYIQEVLDAWEKEKAAFLRAAEAGQRRAQAALAELKARQKADRRQQIGDSFAAFLDGLFGL